MPSSEARPPVRRMAKPRRMASGWPDISSSTSTPVPPVASRIFFSTFSVAGSKAWSAPISEATLRRCALTSMAKTREAPQALATAMEKRPMAPQPVTATVVAAMGPASTVWTALPRGSSNEA